VAAKEGDRMSDEVLRLRGVGVRRDRSMLLRDVDWTAHEDERWVVIGPNGAGKTTLLQVAAAQLFPTAGSVEVLGERLGDVDVFELRSRIGFASAAVADRVPPAEKVIDLVLTASYAILGRWKEDYESSDVTRAVELLDALGCAHLIRRRFSTLSEGERKRVQIARSLMPDPELLLLDEPAAGLDSSESAWLAERLRKVRDSGVTILLIDHDMSLVLGLCAEIHVLDFGALIASGAPGEIRGDQRVATAYLGATHAANGHLKEAHPKETHA
jgi:iron complex transport system ATP-binding protein